MIDTLDFWLVVLFLSIGTYSIRCSFMLLSEKLRISEKTKKIFTYIPAAVLPAIITPMVLFHQGSVEAINGKERFLVLILATLVNYVTNSMVATVSFGLVCLYTVTQFF